LSYQIIAMSHMRAVGFLAPAAQVARSDKLVLTPLRVSIEKHVRHLLASSTIRHAVSCSAYDRGIVDGERIVDVEVHISYSSTQTGFFLEPSGDTTSTFFLLERGATREVTVATSITMLSSAGVSIPYLSEETEHELLIERERLW
jgi:hypothetical protein